MSEHQEHISNGETYTNCYRCHGCGLVWFADSMVKMRDGRLLCNECFEAAKIQEKGTVNVR